MNKIVQELREILEQGGEAVLATIIASSGSTPRGAGSRMLVKADGTIRGTVGGGAVEYQAIMTARKAIKEKTSCIQGFSLTRNQTADIGMVCGGDVAVYFQYAGPENTELPGLCEEIQGALSRDEDSWLILDITGETCWQMGIYDRHRGVRGMTFPVKTEEIYPMFIDKEFFQKKAVQKEAFGRKYYIEPLVSAGTVYIFGGGHVAQELVPLLSHVNFRCVVMDDREAFARPELFPQAEKTIAGDLQRIGDYLEIKPQDYVCIMTRGHQYDYYVQKQALDCSPRYIGIMGSRNKVAVITEKLLQDGCEREKILACSMPIGVEIAAETPAEIAVSIAGELIKVRAGA